MARIAAVSHPIGPTENNLPCAVVPVPEGEEEFVELTPMDTGTMMVVLRVSLRLSRYVKRTGILYDPGFTDDNVVSVIVKAVGVLTAMLPMKTDCDPNTLKPSGNCGSADSPDAVVVPMFVMVPVMEKT
jgi:hypothetical protein